MKSQPPIGGQAVIEGVMMRRGDKVAIAVRNLKNKIVVKKQGVGSVTKKFPILNLPFVRGAVNLIETMKIGMSALSYSANASIDAKDEKLSSGELLWTMIAAIAISLGLFIALPLFLTKLLNVQGVLFNLIDGIIRMGIFMMYLVAISMMRDVKTLFQYHGAEHKSVNCFESGKKLTVVNVRKCSKEHRRCGTTFLLIVMAISIFVFSFVTSPNFLVKLASRILLLPVIAGISYEILKLGAVYQRNFVLNLIIVPGLWLQGLTTREPTMRQIEVAIKAIKAVV
ncbi:DUF1385 domain-containing protein [Candidatus Woesearchaeota archaeon]|nr:DUF1385 domain-containing protein [Candidatus Woesearchaeota archaeon]